MPAPSGGRSSSGCQASNFHCLRAAAGVGGGGTRRDALAGLYRRGSSVHPELTCRVFIPAEYPGCLQGRLTSALKPLALGDGWEPVQGSKAEVTG